MPNAPLALICSVPLEVGPLLPLLEDSRSVYVGRKPATEGRLEGVPVVVLPAGMGKTNATQGTTALLEGRRVRGVISFGVGGAFPGSGLEVGGVALASEEVYGDEGVEAPEGWISTEGIGIPLLEQGGTRLFNHFPLPEARVRRARAALLREGLGARVGRFVTVSSCSGTDARGEELRHRFEAICESMEGAAVAHVCALYRVPFLEARGISNHVENRDLSRWKLREAAEAAARATTILVHSWTDLDETP